MKRQFNNLLCLVVMLFPVFSFSSYAQVDQVEFENPEELLLYQNVIKELRCLVCQNQNLADSDAELAKDLRRKTFEMIRDGKQYDDIIQFMVQRYGEFVLYRPRVTTSTLVLWFAPFVALSGIIIFAIIRIRKSRQTSTINFSDEEIDKVKSLLQKNKTK